MIRDVLAVLAVPCLGLPVCWMAVQSPGGGLAQAGIAAVGFLAVAGISQSIAKGQER
jgi:hypothetical protein